jgi:hypothetical protein
MERFKKRLSYLMVMTFNFTKHLMRRLYNSNGFKFFELSFFYILIPLLVERKLFGEGQMNRAIPLLATFIIFLVLLLNDRSFKNKNLIKLRSYNWKLAAARFLIVGVIAFAYVYFFQPELLFNFVQEKPHKFLIFLVAYPFISVIPQEVIYRVYFFHRYEGIFRNINVLAVFNAILFGYLHFIYDNYIAVVGATVIGIIYVLNYIRTRSLLNVAIEHYAYGAMIFIMGLGKYFK